MISLHFSKANNSYTNFVIASSESKDELIPFLKDTDTKGDVWCLENNYYPLICNLVIKEFPELFKNYFVFRNFENLHSDDFHRMVRCSMFRSKILEPFVTTDEYAAQYRSWYNNNLDNTQYGSEFTPSEIVISPTTFKDRIRWLCGDIQYFFLNIKHKIFK